MKYRYIYILVVALIFIWCKSNEKIEVKPADEHVVMAQTLGRLLETGSPRIWTTLSEKSGTSVYMIIYICDNDECIKSENYKLLGAVLPENSSTRVTGEVFSYTLARVLGVGDICGPGAHIILRGEGLKKFKGMILNARYSGLKENNRRNLINMINGTDKLYCVYKKWDYNPCDLDKLENSGYINSDNILAKYIKADNIKPASEMINLTDLSSRELHGQGKAVDLAKQLSNIMIIDILTAQWDRWSGGNIQAILVNGKIKISALDNGGTFKYSSTRLNDYFSIVTRFDRSVAGILIKMDAFLNKKTIKSFLDFKSENDLKEYLGVIKGPDNLSKADWIWFKFKQNLSLIIKHIKNSEYIYGRENCYF